MTSSASVVRSLPAPRPAGLAAAGHGPVRPPLPEGAAPETSLSQLVAPFVWHRWMVAGFVFLGILIAATLALTTERQYAATAKLLVGNEAGTASRLNEARVGFEEQIELLRGPDLAQRVIESLDLADHPMLVDVDADQPRLIDQLVDQLIVIAEPLPVVGAHATQFAERRALARAQAEELREERRLETMLRRFNERLSISQQGTSSVLAVTFRAESPRMAAAVANALVEGHVAAQLEGGRNAMAGAAAILQEQLERLDGDVRAAEAAVADYRDSTGLGGDPAAEQRLAVLEQRLLDNRAALAAQEDRVARLTALRAAGDRAGLIAELETVPAIQRLVGEGVALGQRISQEGVTLGERHPSMLALREELAEVERRIDVEIARRIAAEQAEIDRLASTGDSLRLLVADIETRLSERDRAGIGLAELERRANAARELHESFMRDSLAVAAERALVRPRLRVIQSASPPTQPAAPNTKVMLVLGAIAGGVAGAVAAHLAEFRANTFRSARDVARATNAPVLAVVPRIRQRRRRSTALDDVRDRPRSLVADRLTAALITALAGIETTEGGRVILVTSSQPGDGKSTVAMSLALLAAGSGEQTLFFDADLRRSVFATDAGLKERLGLLDLATPAAEREACRFLLEPRSKLCVLTELGGPDDDPHRVLQAGKMAGVLRELRRRFDLIVIDTPPLLAVSDAHHLMPLADGVIMVSRLGETGRNDLQDAVTRLELARAPLLGNVLIDANGRGRRATRYYAR
jgi:capsular exopolysaccharide synthesis family protein